MILSRMGGGFALCAVVVLAGCGGATPMPQPEVQVPTGPYAIAAQATPGESWTPIVLGQGIDGVSGAPRGVCLSAPKRVDPSPTGYLSSGSMSAWDAALLLSPDDDIPRLPFESERPLARFARAHAESELSAGGSFALGLYSLDVESVDGGFPSWQVAPDGADFVTRCGDWFVRSRERGGQLLALLRFDFADDAARARFRASGISPTPSALADPALLAPFAGSVGIHVAALQRGGDPARLSRRLRPEGSAEVASLWSRDCSAADSRPCRDFLRAVVAYAGAAGADGFAEGLAANPADLTRALWDWPIALRSNQPRRLPDGVFMARLHLRPLRETQEAVAERIRIFQAGILSASAPVQARLAAAESALASNLAALRAAERACHGDLTDPADATQVARCADGARPEALAAAGYDATLTVTSLSAP